MSANHRDPPTEPTRSTRFPASGGSRKPTGRSGSITAFLWQSTGYSIGILFVDHPTSGTPDGVATSFAKRGTRVSRDEFEKAESTHCFTTIFSLSIAFFCVGEFLFLIRAARPEAFLLVEPFIPRRSGASGSRGSSRPAFWLVMVSEYRCTGCYAVMILLILKELWLRR